MNHKKLYFLHIKKTAGSTVHNVLSTKFYSHEICPFQFTFEFPLDKRIFEKYEYFWGHTGLDFVELYGNKLNVFTFLREPSERFISEYYFWHHKGIDTRDKGHVIELAPNVGLEEYLNNQLVIDQRSNLQVKSLSLGILNPNMQHIKEKDLLVKAKLFVDNIYFLGITEQTELSLDLLFLKQGWIPINQAPKINVTPDKKDLNTHTPEVIERIKDLNTYDYKLYIYAKKLFINSTLKVLIDLVNKHKNSITSEESIKLKIFINDFKIDFKTNYSLVRNIFHKLILLERKDKNIIVKKYSNKIWKINEIDFIGNCYQLEYPISNPTQPFRWLGPDKFTEIYLPINRLRSRKLYMRFPHIMNIESFLNVFKIKIDEITVKWKRVDKRQMREYQDVVISINLIKKSIFKSIFNKYTKITIITPETNELTPNDSRKAIIAIDSVSVE